MLQTADNLLNASFGQVEGLADLLQGQFLETE